MTTLVAVLAAMVGTFWIYSGVVLQWRGLYPFGSIHRHLGAVGGGRDVRGPAIHALAAACIGALSVVVVFGALVPAAAVGVWASTVPSAAARQRRVERHRAAASAWPQLLEAVRSRTSCSGTSIPAALFDAAADAPNALTAGFVAGRREWERSTDFDRACAVMRREFRSGVADVVLETLAIAHEVGGRDLDRRLRVLIDDRSRDLDAELDADARRAGARFGRRFVLAVPVGMALAGISIGDGRAAYATPAGQVLGAGAIGLVAACWWWAGRLLGMPAAGRRFL